MTLWERERKRCTPGWVVFEEMEAAFSHLAFAMIDENMPIDIPREWGVNHLGSEEMLRAGRNANLLEVRGDRVRFYHQLIQEYFAAVDLARKGPTTRLELPQFVYWRREPSKWDQIIIALCGITSEIDSALDQISALDPCLAVMCIASGTSISETTRQRIITNLLATLQAQNRDARAAAAEALGQIQDVRSLPSLLDALWDWDWFVRATAAVALGQIGNAIAVPNLLNALRDTDYNVREAATKALVQIGAPALPGLLDALGDTDSDVRWTTAKALERIDWQPPDTESKVVYYIFSGRCEKCISLGRAAVPGLLNALQDRDSNLRQAAAEALKKISWQPSDLREKVIYYILSERLTKCVALGDAAVPYLLGLLQNTNNDVRQSAVTALGQIRTAAALPALLGMLGDRDKDIRRVTAAALGQIGDVAALPALLEALRDRAESVRRAAVGALGQIGDVAALPALLEALRDRAKSVRRAAVGALGQIGDVAALPALCTALYDQDKNVCRVAATALKHIGTPEAIAAVKVWQRSRKKTNR